MMSIRTRLIAGFSLLVFFLLVQAATTFYYVQENEALVTAAINRDFSANAAITDMAVEGHKMRRFEKEYFMYIGDRERADNYHKEWQSSYVKLEKMVGYALKNESGIWGDADVAEIRSWQAALNGYGDGFDVVAAGIAAGRIKSTIKANDAIKEAKDRFRVLLDGTAKMGTTKHAQALRSALEIKDNFWVVDAVLGATAAVSIALAVLLLVILPASISRPVQALVESAQRMSTGDLSQPIALTGVAEFENLSAVLDRLRISQRTLIDRLRAATLKPGVGGRA
ncbi:MAG: hypothetical protein A2637_04310 [Candidatus Muproteobacteria bacterium RIFCSPHIGHO2_01_FULL_65_16]|uniref:HAMP domain-containing protein n=1 Tax=Candidatus Muproteobacteria bacterium RIFCSPHIGHO2_01_FULL_65_16 TaxID=1817764 RepID=A0A1F6TPA6_9PROT|nr:MAG: hypothetical protein A2637_04310 [Candidatus Muproteobacteria bacterium RIFCSPHIGHO2_01_FULL_65_16]